MTAPMRYKSVEVTEEVLQMTATLTGESIEIAGDEIILHLRFQRPRQLPDLSKLADTPVSDAYSYRAGSRLRLKLERVESTSVEVDAEEPAA